MELGAGDFPGSSFKVTVVEIDQAHGTTGADLSLACPTVSSKVWAVRYGPGIAPDHGETRDGTVFVTGFHVIRRGGLNDDRHCNVVNQSKIDRSEILGAGCH